MAVHVSKEILKLQRTSVIPWDRKERHPEQKASLDHPEKIKRK